jgi:hypothetical protein
MPPENRVPEATENSPLLRDEEQSGIAVSDGGHDGTCEAQDAPLAEEPGTKKLLAIMSAMWLGSFFAALGKSPGSPLCHCYQLTHQF